MDLLQNCSVCYAAQLSQFPQSISIKGALAPNTAYIVKVTDKFGNRFSTAPTDTDSSGVLTFNIPVSFPTGWFSSTAGNFEIEVSQTAQPWTPATLTFDSQAYTCIEVCFVNDNSGVNTIE
jgi:hypothetical protein